MKLADLLNYTNDEFAPHDEAGFEGHYTRMQLLLPESNMDSTRAEMEGGTLAIIFCWVKTAEERPYLVHVSYTPAPGTHYADDKTNANNDDWTKFGFKQELFPKAMETTRGSRVALQGPTTESRRIPEVQPFTVKMAHVGAMDVSQDTISYFVSRPDIDLELEIEVSQRIPWSGSHQPLAGPMGIFSHLSPLLPLNWYVWSTASSATYNITYQGRTVRGNALAHAEKNWGTSFPKGWIWFQAFGASVPASISSKTIPSAISDTTDGIKPMLHNTSLCLAGGEALPYIQAYLIGYRSSRFHWDFRPPFTLALGPIFPFMSVHHSSKRGAFSISIETFTRKLAIEVHAPVSSFMSLACPLKDGHQPRFAYESFEGRTYVRAWTRSWPWQAWTVREEGWCGVDGRGDGRSALEFGGSYAHWVTEDVDVGLRRQ